MSQQPEAVIHVVDDDASMRTALGRLLTMSGYAVRSYASAGEFLIADPDRRPGCLLLDLELAGPSGIDLQNALRRQRNPMPIVFMSAYRDVPRTVMAIKGGAADFLLKPLDSQALLAALESALSADHLEPCALAPLAPPDLSERERTVLRGIVAGRLNKQIAAELDLSERTIKTCRADLMRKFGAHSLAELVRLGEPLSRC